MIIHYCATTESSSRQWYTSYQSTFRLFSRLALASPLTQIYPTDWEPLVSFFHLPSDIVCTYPLNEMDTSKLNLRCLNLAAPIANCNQFERVKAGFYTVAVACTSLLIFLRVRAVFEKNRYIVVFFAISWLAVFGSCLTVTQGRQGGEIGPTNYCITLHLQEYISSSVIAPLANDTLVFLAISWKLMKNTHVEDGVKAGFRAIVFGDSMPAFSRALLRDGQVYYL